MSLRNQPYIPLYVQDFICDVKLRECSASSVGVYIFMMCLFHKSEVYGTLQLKERDRKTGNNISDFALKLTRHLPFDRDTIENALEELLETGVLSTVEDGSCLYQKRMVRDGENSKVRAASGRGKSKTAAAAPTFAPAKVGAKCEAKAKQIPEYENENENESEYEIVNETETDTEEGGTGEEELSEAPALPLVDGSAYSISINQFERWQSLYPATDVIQELRNMAGWLDANPKRRKTRAGILRFANNWLAKEQDKGGKGSRDGWQASGGGGGPGGVGGTGGSAKQKWNLQKELL